MQYYVRLAVYMYVLASYPGFREQSLHGYKAIYIYASWVGMLAKVANKEHELLARL